MSYVLLKHLHISCVVLSGLGFLLRAYWMATVSSWLQHRLTRTVPHIVDSVLLGSALLMAWMSGQFPLAQDWLTAKLIGLILYIAFGMMALKRGKTRRIRLACVVLAVLAYIYIVVVARHRQIWPF